MAFNPYPAMPEIAQAYENDPRTKIAASMLKNGTSTAPLAQGKYAFGDAFGRAMQAIAGTLMQKKSLDKYQDQEKLTAAQLAAVMSGGAVPQGIDKAGLISPDNLADPLAEGGAPAPGVGGIGAGAGTGVPGGALPMPTNNGPTPPPVPQAPQNISPPVPNQGGGGMSAIAGAMGAPAPQQPPMAQQQQQADPRAFFNNFTVPSEGSKTVTDSNGAPVQYGINKAFNKNANVGKLSQEQAGDIFEDKYWKGSGADKLNNPALSYMHADTYYLNPSKSKEILAASGGDPAKYMELRRDFLNGLSDSNPAKFGKYREGWENRNQRLEKYAQTFGGNAGAAQIQTATGAKLAVPEMPGMPAEPEAPHATARAQSNSLSMAKALMATQNPFLMQTAQRMLEKGQEEDFQSQGDYAKRADGMASDVYGKQSDRFNNADQVNRQFAANSRLQANSQVAQSSDTAYSQGQENARTAQQIAAQKSISAGNNATSIRVAEIGAGSRADQAQARQGRWLQTPQGTRAWQNAQTIVGKNNKVVSDLQEFAKLQQKVATGGIGGTAIGNGLRQIIGGPDYQRLRQLTDQLTPMMRVAGDIMSDKDAERYKRSVPNSGNLKDANEGTIQFMVHQAERENDYVQSGLVAQSNNDTPNFMKEWNTFKNRVPFDSGITFDQWKQSLPQVDANGKVAK